LKSKICGHKGVLLVTPVSEEERREKFRERKGMTTINKKRETSIRNQYGEGPGLERRKENLK